MYSFLQQLNVCFADKAAIEVCFGMPQTVIMIYVLAYPHFEIDVSRSLTAFREVHEKKRAKLVAPHITLVFGLADSISQEITALCEQIASQTSVIPIQFSNSEIVYDSFENTNKIFLLTSVGRDSLMTLHDQFYDGSHHKELGHDEPYRPHMTVATNLDRSVIEDIDTTPLGSFPIKSIINSLDVVKLADGKLSTIGSFPLGM